MIPRNSLRPLVQVGKLAAAAAVAGLLVAAIAVPAVGGIGLSARDSARYFQSLPNKLDAPPLPQRSTILAADGSRIANFYYRNRIPVDAEEIAPVMRRAMVAIEDARFYKHNGVDLQGLGRAAVINLRAGGIVQGGSTLTQQYVENVLELKANTPKEREVAQAQNVSGKLREMQYALALEDQLTKKQILTRYLNISYFGDGAYGVESAARHYFDKHASDLTLPEAALIAGTVKAPSRYNPTENPELAKQRRNVVIDRMADVGVITKHHAREAKESGLGLDVQEMQNGCSYSKAPFFCIYIREEIKHSKAFGETKKERLQLLRRGGLTIHTTLKPAMQKEAKQALRDYVPPKHSSQKAAAEAMIQPGTGNIRALAVSLPYGNGRHETSINLAADMAHGNTTGFQAGSTFKAFTLATALKQDMPFSHSIYAPYELHPGTFTDCQGNPIELHGWSPQNFSTSENGPYNIKTGTWLSVNTFFVQLENQVGLCNVVNTARQLGLEQSSGQPLPDGTPSFTLGTVPVAPVDMASAYATFAARGKRCDPIAITKVIDRRGKKMDIPDANCQQVIPKDVADAVNYILQGVLDQGTASGSDISRPAAGKTGTLTDYAGAWFAGYTPKLSSAVWVGDPRGGGQHPLKNVTIGGSYYSRVEGATIPAPIWQQSMQEALDGPVEGFVRPPGHYFYVPKPQKPDNGSGGSGHSGDEGDSSGGDGPPEQGGPPDVGGGNWPPGGGPPGNGGGPPGVGPPGNGNGGGPPGSGPPGEPGE